MVSIWASGASAAGFGFALAHQVELGGGTVRGIVFSPAGDAVIVAGGARVVRFGFTPEGGPILEGELVGTRGEVFGADVSPDGTRVAAVDESGSLVVWDAATGQVVRRCSGAHRGEGRAVTFTSDGRYLVTGDEEGEVRVWTAEGLPFTELSVEGRRSRGEVRAILPDGSGRDVFTVDEKGNLDLWDVDTQRQVRPTRMDMKVMSAAVGGRGRVLALGLRRLEVISKRVIDSLRLIDGETGQEIHDIRGDEQDLTAIAVSPDGRFVVVGGSGRRASVWDVETGRPITRIPLDSAVSSVAFGASGRWLAIGTKKGSVSLFELTGVGADPGRPANPFRPRTDPVIIAVVEPAAASLGRDGARIPVASSSLRVQGTVSSPAPLERLSINGTEITSIDGLGPGEYRFTAHVPLMEPGPRRIEIVATNQRGELGRESFVVDREETASPADPGRGRRIALIIGVSRYSDESIDLAYADDDARALRDLLVSPDLGPASFEPEDVRLLVDEEATVTAINVGLRDFLRRATEDDFVLFFFAGHGAPDPNRLQDLYLLAHDTDPDNIAGTGLLMRHVREAISSIRARGVLILTDSCHSGGIGGSSVERSIETNPIHHAFLDKMRHSSGGLAILTASEAAQKSIEEPSLGHGLFTWYLIEALRGAADVNGDRVVTLGETMEHVREQVRRVTEGKQVPAIGPTSFDRQLPLAVVVDETSQ
jgi:hypothetical protein